METIVLIPAILCIIAIYRRGTEFALRVVILPSLLLIPTYFYWTARPLPGLNFIDSGLLVLGVGMALTNLKRWRFTRMDLWMLIFLLTVGYTDYMLDRTTIAAFEMFNTILAGLVPYMAGKLIIEQTRSRISVAKMYVWLISASSLLSAWEYLFRNNLYTWFWSHFFPGQWAGWRTQIRWGFGRVAGPFSQSELAGMMVFTAWLLALWVGRTTYEEKETRSIPATLLKHGKRHIWIVFAVLFMTQARGPWIGAVIALAVASIGRSRQPLRRGIIVFTCFIVIGAPIYLWGKDYLAGPRKDYGSERETAQYREELIQNYIPVAERGGPFGWGEEFPRIGGQDSIDNEYLWAWILQGYVGAIALILLIVEASGKLLVQGVRARTVRDRHFAFTLLGIVLGIAFTISTVFLGDQSYELLFLMLGWSQAIHEPVARTSRILNRDYYRPGMEQSALNAGI